MRIEPITGLLIAVAAIGIACAQVGAGPLEETRYCGTPARTASGEIKRRADVVAAFKRIHPCPVTGLTSGPCPGWEVDHIVPLACGGCDAVSNLQWLPITLKRAPDGKDGFERKIYGGIVPGTGCTVPPWPN